MSGTRKGTSILNNGLIWFGAGVSIAEILTGTYLAPLGMAKGLAAILLGHVIGCSLLFLAGLIGGFARRSAMETVKMSFGHKGSLLFSTLNVLQLLGWTAIMIYDGALAAGGALGAGQTVWCLVIGGLILVWILIGIRNLGKINTVAMAALFILTLILCKVIFFGRGGGSMAGEGEAMSFGAAVELSVAMPLSWLPLISDYTREAEKPLAATAASAVVYGLVGMMVLLPAIRKTFDIAAGDSLLAAIIVLAVMILPSIISVSETALNAVPREYEEASLALGATELETYFRVSVPAAKSGIAAAVVLGVGRAIGEAMAILMVAGNVANMPSLLSSVKFLTTAIASEMSYAAVGSLQRNALYSIGLILFLFIMCINVILNVFLKRNKEG